MGRCNHDWNGEPIGNITKEDIEQVWNNSVYYDLRQQQKTLEITDIRVERVQDISGEDALLEGVQIWFDNHPKKYRNIELGESTSIQFFNVMWNEINAKRGYGWETNSWVWVISFKVCV